MLAPNVHYSRSMAHANWIGTSQHITAALRGRVVLHRGHRVEASARITPGCLGLNSDANEASLSADSGLGAARSKAAVMPARHAVRGIEPHP